MTEFLDRYGCNCGVKTPQPGYHAKDCPIFLFRDHDLVITHTDIETAPIRITSGPLGVCVDKLNAIETDLAKKGIMCLREAKAVKLYPASFAVLGVGDGVKVKFIIDIKPSDEPDAPVLPYFSDIRGDASAIKKRMIREKRERIFLVEVKRQAVRGRPVIAWSYAVFGSAWESEADFKRKGECSLSLVGISAAKGYQTQKVIRTAYHSLSWEDRAGEPGYSPKARIMANLTLDQLEANRLIMPDRSFYFEEIP